ncbi:MAG: beta-lactamase class D [Lysobacterales bacterium]
MISSLLNRLLVCAASAALFISASASSSELSKPVTEYFGKYSGCALILSRDRHSESRLEIGAEQCATQLSPCSTFKIPNALIGLQSGVVTGPGHLKPWDGRQHQRVVNNQDHTLASAVENSVVWYFQSLAFDVGTVVMQQWLDKLEYGNRDISAGIDHFWLGSSLKIDAHQQLDLLIDLKHKTLPFKPVFQQQLQDMLVQDSDLAGTLHAKTGSCRGASGSVPDHGWFVGWIDWEKNIQRNPASTWFVINIIGEDAWGWNARPIAIELLQELQP